MKQWKLTAMRRIRIPLGAILLSICSVPVLFSSLPTVLFPAIPAELELLEQAYPDVVFTASFDSDKNDWKIAVTSDGRITVLYFAGGRLLLPDQLPASASYRPLLYPMPESVLDPSTFTPEQIERITHFGSTENRITSPVSSTAFFDALYGCETRESTENRISSITFLGKKTRVHEKIVPSLLRIENAIRTAAQTDRATAEFIRTLKSAEGYFWRTIRDTSGKSFHSMGLAIDLLPRDSDGKAIYWNWIKASGNDQWMLVPLSERWMPPRTVIAAFEREGFIWGGKWAIWDNMHFEYRPELHLVPRKELHETAQEKKH